MSYNNQSDYHRTNQDHDTNYDYFPKANIQMLLKLEERISGGAPDSGNHLEASNAFEDD